METVSTVGALRAALGALRAGGNTIAFVPTMGNLHAGHLRLVEVARQRAVHVVVSIFVNPTQFDRAEDFAAYPRTLAADLAQLACAGVDLVYTPTLEALYPDGPDARAWVDPAHGADTLEGAHRPGHFRGMATVVTKLLNATQPDCAVFGEKDYQQLAIVRAVVRELLLPVEVLGVPTVRAADGLALSSRNQRLSAEERAQAPLLYGALRAAAQAAQRPDADFAAIERTQIAALEGAGFRVDYFSLCDAQLRPPKEGKEALVVLVAAWLGRTRLIDNLPFRRVPTVV